MSNTDGFIAEVEEELRRDKFTALLRRYGWIAALAIIALVGGTGFNEYRKATATAEAEARGDAISAALEAPTSGARAEALAAEGGILESFMAASEFQAAGDDAAAAAVLAELAAQPELSPLYRDLAQVKRLAIDTEIDANERALILSALSAPGAPYRTVAQELAALDQVAAGEQDAAITAFQALLQDADASDVQKRRVAEILVALGAEPELANSLPGGNALAPLE
ncbi:MAG: hypothetical protein AAFZ02_07000 [Pseudomonadota bacterium]